MDRLYKLIEIPNFIENEEIYNICENAIRNNDNIKLHKIIHKIIEFYKNKQKYKFLQQVIIPLCMKYNKYNLIYKIIDVTDDINIEDEIKYTIRHLIYINDIKTLQKLFNFNTKFNNIITIEYIQDVLLTMKKVREDEIIKAIMDKYINDHTTHDKKCYIL